MPKGKNFYKLGEVVDKDGKQFMVGQDGELHRLAKTGTKPKANWETRRTESVPYASGKYDVKIVENTNATSKMEIISISQWLLNEDGTSKIKTKENVEIPKKTISLSGDRVVVKKIANALLTLCK